MNAATAVEWPSFAPNRSRTDSGPQRRRGQSFGLDDLRSRLFGNATTTTMQVVNDVADAVPTIADRLDQLKNLAELTDEQIAEILGTTRQTLHNWRTGKRISARREQRLEKTLQAIQAASVGDSQQTHRLVMSGGKGRVRIYDLLVEGSVDAAIAAASGKPMETSPLPIGYSVATRMELIEDRTPVSKPRIDRRFSKKL